MQVHRAAVGAILAGCLLAAPTTSAQEVWVKDVVNLNLRTGPGNQYRITGLLKTGDSVRIVKRAEGWTQVRQSDGKEGWVPIDKHRQTCGDVEGGHTLAWLLGIILIKGYRGFRAPGGLQMAVFAEKEFVNI